MTSIYILFIILEIILTALIVKYCLLGIKKIDEINPEIKKIMPRFKLIKKFLRASSMISQYSRKTEKIREYIGKILGFLSSFNLIRQKLLCFLKKSL